ncbi:hypothetical protein GCM10009077_08730 [Roseibium denhamense]
MGAGPAAEGVKDVSSETVFVVTVPLTSVCDALVKAALARNRWDDTLIYCACACKY